MKKFLILIPVLFFFFQVRAQEGTLEGSHYTYGDLDKLGKLDLTDIYIQQVQKLNLLMPYVPFNQKGEAVSLTNMGIPNTKENNQVIKKLDGSGGTHNEAVDESLASIIPYADKEEVIKAILFVQSTIERLEAGL